MICLKSNVFFQEYLYGPETDVNSEFHDDPLSSKNKTSKYSREYLFEECVFLFHRPNELSLH